MTQYSYACLALSTVLLAASAAAAQKNHDCKKDNTGTCVYDLSSGTVTGQTQRGPGRVKATNLNTIRYDYEFNSAVTYQASPDIWSGLSSLATVNSAPVPSPSNAQAAAATQPVSASIRARVPEVCAQDAFEAVCEAMKTAEGQIASANQVNTNLKNQWQYLTDLNKDTTQLKTYQNNANAAIAIVASGGSSLVNYLNFTTNSSEDLVRATKDQLADQGTADVDGVNYTTTSLFIAGTKAVWPDASLIVTLQNDLVKHAADLSTLNASLANDLTTVKASETAVSNAINQLNTAFDAFTAAKNKPAPDQSSQVQGELNSLNATLALLQADEKDLGQAPTLVTAAVNQNASDTTAVATLLPSSSAYASFIGARNALLQWKAKMTTTLENWREATANPKTAKDPFSRESDYENCGFAFSSTKDTVVTLTRVDLAPGATNTSPQTVLTVKIECTSPFSLSAGVAFSTIPDHEFTISQVQTTSGGTTTTSNVITENSTSNFHPLPLALASMRFWEPNEKFSAAFSFGVAANIRDQTSGGSTAEYLIGPSFELFRTLIITTGVHLGSEASVGGGYAVNSTVPSSITTVPINTKYTGGFGLGISFTKP